MMEKNVFSDDIAYNDNEDDNVADVDGVEEKHTDAIEEDKRRVSRPVRKVAPTEEYLSRRFLEGMQRTHTDTKQFLIKEEVQDKVVIDDGDLIEYSLMQRCIEVLFAQMSASEGIKKFGERGLAAVVKEFTQLNEGAVPSQNKPIVVPIDPSMLTKEERRKH